MQERVILHSDINHCYATSGAAKDTDGGRWS